MSTKVIIQKMICQKMNCLYPCLSAKSLARLQSTTRRSSRSSLLPTSMISGSSQQACVCSWLIQLRTFKNDSSLVRSNMRMKPMASRKNAVVRLRKRSWPAVSHSCRCIRCVRPFDGDLYTFSFIQHLQFSHSAFSSLL